MAYEELSTVQDTAIIREKNKMLELVVAKKDITVKLTKTNRNLTRQINFEVSSQGGA